MPHIGNTLAANNITQNFMVIIILFFEVLL